MTAKGQATQRWTLAGSILASSLAFVDGSVTNVALPAIKADLQTGAVGLQWVINAYLLPLSALLLLGGAMGDRFGRRRMFLGGIVLFAIASIACALAPSLEVLLAGRIIQGIGAAMLMPNSLALLGGAFEGEARGRAIGTWAAAGAIAGALGPLAGGWLVQTVGWRAIFYVNLPLAAGALLIGYFRVPERREDKLRAIDWAGVAIATLALGAMTWGLTTAGGDNPQPTLGGAVAGGGLLLFALFVWLEKHRGDDAIMPLAMFGTKSFAGLTILTFLLYAAMGGLFVILPYMLIENQGYSPAHAGAALLPLPAVLGISGRIMGGIAGRIGPRLPLTIGPAIVAIGFALMLRVTPEASYWTSTLPALLVISIGMAGAVAPLTTAVMASVDGDHVGTANGFNSAVARTGGLIATALLGGVLAAKGDDLTQAFHLAALVAAGASAGAALSALLLLRADEIKSNKKAESE
jgi:EmrB/QacA subfamily drug resistance transporter